MPAHRYRPYPTADEQQASHDRDTGSRRRGGKSGRGPRRTRNAPPALSVEELSEMRSKTTPFLLRIFWSEHDRIPTDMFCSKEREPQHNVINVYTWDNATLRELADKVQEMVPPAQELEKELLFDHIYIDTGAGRAHMAHIGKVQADRSRPALPEERKSLQKFSSFRKGDYLQVTIRNAATK